MAEAEEAVMARLASKGRPMDHGGVWRQPKLPLPTAPELSPSPLGLAMAWAPLRRQDRSLT